MVKVQIPKIFLNGFSSIAKLESETIEQIGVFLQNISPGTGNKTFQKEFEKSFPSLDASTIAPTIFSLAAFHASEFKDITTDELTDSLIESYREQTQSDSLEAEKLKKSLVSLIGNLDTIFLSLKAFNLLNENERTFTNAHIITDIRLIFKDDIAVKDRHAIVIHNLKLTIEENDASEEYFFTLDSNDLKNLKEQIERAEEKERLIKEHYAASIEFITTSD